MLPLPWIRYATDGAAVLAARLGLGGIRVDLDGKHANRIKGFLWE